MVHEILKRGEENAIRTAELVRLCGLRSARDLQSSIAAEREQGILILSTCRNGGGYFLPADGEQGRQEIAAFVATLRARALNTFRALRDARRALAKLDGQISLGEDESAL